MSTLCFDRDKERWQAKQDVVDSIRNREWLLNRLRSLLLLKNNHSNGRNRGVIQRGKRCDVDDDNETEEVGEESVAGGEQREEESSDDDYDNDNYSGGDIIDDDDNHNDLHPVRIHRLLMGLHTATLCVVEAIQTMEHLWNLNHTQTQTLIRTRTRTRTRPQIATRNKKSFCVQWNKQNYILKLLTDLDFVWDDCHVASFLLGIPTTDTRNDHTPLKPPYPTTEPMEECTQKIRNRNPFLLPFNIDDTLAYGHWRQAHRQIHPLPFQTIQSKRREDAMAWGPWKDRLDWERIGSAATRIVLEERRFPCAGTQQLPNRFSLSSARSEQVPVDRDEEQVQDVGEEMVEVDLDDLNEVGKITFWSSFDTFPGNVAEREISSFTVGHDNAANLQGSGNPEVDMNCPLQPIFEPGEEEDEMKETLNKENQKGKEHSKSRKHKYGLDFTGALPPMKHKFISEENAVHLEHCHFVSGQNSNHKDEKRDMDSFVPVPASCSASVTEGSTRVSIFEGNPVTCLAPGDCIRISHARFSHDYTVSSHHFCTDQFYLTKPYDHSPVTQKEIALKEETLARLHCPYSKQKSEDLEADHDKDNNIDKDSSRSSSNSIGLVTVTENGCLALTQARIWKLIPKDTDKRQVWRVQYDDGQIPWKSTFTEDSGHGVYFRIKLKWCAIEELCRDVVCNPDHAIHEQRLFYFERVPLRDIIVETYETVCQWHPVGNSIDNVKWAKLARKMKFLSSVKNSNHEVDMAFVRHSHERKLTIAAFESILRDMASLKYPLLKNDCNVALAHMLWSTVAILPRVSEMIWNRAKEMAMVVEMRKTCAQIRIAALFRKLRQRHLYLRERWAATCVSKNVRCWIAWTRRKRIMQMLENDRIFRIHYRCAVLCQKTWRRFYWRKRFKIYVREKRDLEMKELEERKQKLREKRKRMAASIVFQKTLCIQSVLTIVTMVLTDPLCIDQTTEMEIRIYVPQTQEMFKFLLPEKEIRECLEKALNANGSLSWNEMLKPEALLLVTKRLMARIICGRPIIIFSRRDIAEKGRPIWKQSIRSGADIYILSLYRSDFDVVVQVYDPRNCQQLRKQIVMSTLTEWLMAEKEDQMISFCLNMITSRQCSRQGKSSESRNRTLAKIDSNMGVSSLKEVELLKAEKEPELIRWLVRRIKIMRDNVTGKSTIVLLYEAEEDRQEKISRKIQSVWRSKCARKKAKEESYRQYEKIFDRSLQQFLYIHIPTGIRLPSKPVLLGNDDIDDPVDEWRVMEHQDEQTGQKLKYFANYLTGQTSWLSEEDAARLVQRLYRKRQSADLLGPKLDLGQVAKTLKFVNDIENSFAGCPEKLSNRVNFALLNHCHRFDFDTARPLYKVAIEKSPCHPIIARAYGIFVLASCEAPMAQTLQRACRYFKEAALADPKHAKFQSAMDHFFYWAVLMYPKNAIALLNYALLHQCILKDYDRAEKLYRRALAEDSFNRYITQNYQMFQDQSYPGGIYATKGPSFTIVGRSIVIEERPEWGEWKKMKDPLCTKLRYEDYWYDTLQKVASFEEPDWKKVWEVRVKRSQCLSSSDKSIWVQYHDEKLNKKFTYSRSSGEYICN